MSYRPGAIWEGVSDGHRLFAGAVLCPAAGERMLAAELALTREEAQLAACALLDVLPERCFTQGEVPSA